MKKRMEGAPSPRSSQAYPNGSSVSWLEWTAIIGWGLLVAVLTLLPGPYKSSDISSQCVLCGDFGGADAIRNILMFMPAGVFLIRRGVSPSIAIGIGFCISAGIEGAQLVIPGRHASLRDILINGIGSGAGALLYFGLVRSVRVRSRLGLVAASLFPLVGVGATGWLSQIIGTDGVYFAQWVPERPDYASWNGVLRSASIGGVPTPIGVIRDSNARRAALAQGAPVVLRIERGTPTTSLTAFYVVMDDNQREILMIGALGHDLVVRHRLRSTLVRLDLPDLRFPEFLFTAPADTLTVQMTRDSAGLVCVSNSRGTSCAPRPSIGSAWGLILWNGTLSSRIRRALDGATLVLLLLPAAVAFGAAHRSRGWLGFLTLLCVTVALARSSGLAWPGVVELAAATLTLPLGYALHRIVLQDEEALVLAGSLRLENGAATRTR